MQLTGFLLMLSLAGQVPPAESSVPPPGSLGAPPQADTSPTAWSCTVETLSSGKDCVFESQAPKATDLKAQEALNIRFARELAPSACGRAASASGGKADKKLVELCQREFASVAERCGLAGQWPLVDAKGRFAPAARPCYLALAEVLQHTGFASAVVSQCCQCLAATGCKGTAEKCYRDLARGAPDAAEQACMSRSCAQECSTVPVSAPEPQGAERAPVQPTSHPGSHVL